MKIMSEKGMVVCMEKYAWCGKIVPGMQEEYKKRHDNIWPEMKEVLAKAGIVNYSIWMQGEELFGYYECEKGVDYAAKVQAESGVVKKWDEYMKDILIMEKDPVTGAQPLLTQVFSFR
jgi:L-rhamnose mutarotase